MNAALELEPAVSPFPLDHHDNFFEAAQTGWVGTQDFSPPASGFSVARVHAIELTAKKGRFVASCPGSYFDNDVLTIVGIFGQNQKLEAVFQIVLALAQHADFFFSQFPDRF